MLKLPRAAIGVLTLTAAAPVAVMEWQDLVQQRDALQAQVDTLQAMGSGHAHDVTVDELEARPASYAGEALDPTSLEELSRVREERTQLAIEAAALRRELARSRTTPQAGWDRAEGTLDDLGFVDAPAAASGSASEPVDLLFEEGQILRRRLQAADRDMEEVQVERDEALAQLRREMFTSLLYSSIIGECGHRNGKRAFDACAEDVRTALYPHWQRFESCIRDYNAVPAYTQTATAQDVFYAVRLDRGAVLMCDPQVPEGGL